MRSIFKTLLQSKTNVKLYDSQYEELEALYVYLMSKPHVIDIKTITLDVNLSDLKICIYLEVLSNLEIIKKENNYVHVYNYSLFTTLEQFLMYYEISKIPLYRFSEYQKIIITAFICSNNDYMNTVIQYLENKEVDRICDILNAFNQIIK